MPNSKGKQGCLVLAWSEIYKGRPRDRVAAAMRELVAANEPITKIRPVYISGYLARDLGVTRAKALEIMAHKGIGAKDNGETKRNATQEMAYGRARVACRAMEDLAGIPPNKKRSDAKKRSSPRRSRGGGMSRTITVWQFRKLMRASRRR
jgi:hypothetical protein